MGDKERGALVNGGFRRSLTTFIGRDAETHRLEGLLTLHRLVTITGPGGVGKTRLAAEVTRTRDEQFRDGIRLVELAAISDPEQTPWAVAATLGIQDSPDHAIVASITAALSSEQSLLVLDNCEQVLGGVAELCQELLSGSDDIRILATSREQIGVPGEAQLRLAPLPTDPDASGQRQADGVALFLDRVRLREPAFAVTAHTTRQAAEIIARIDGLPLAIELAAARVESMGMTQLLQRLDEPLRILTGGARTTERRHRSLWATADWSYQLLSEQSRRVFRRLAILPGAFTLDTAVTVAGDQAESAILSQVDASILTPPNEGPDGRTRYLMLHGLRAYGREQLESSGEMDDATSAMNSCAVALAEDAAALMQAGGGEASATAWFDAESALLHSALLWSLDHARDDHGQALRLGLALAPWWRLRGLRSMGYPMLSRAADRSSGSHDSRWRTAQNRLGRLALGNCAWQTAMGHFTTVRDASELGAHSTELVDALVGRSAALRNVGQFQAAADDAGRARDLARAGGNAEGEVGALVQLILTASSVDDADTARRWHAQLRQIDTTCLPDELARQINTVDTIVLSDAAEWYAARQVCLQGLESALTVMDIAAQADLLYLMTQIALRSGDISQAAVHIRESLRLAARSGHRLQLLNCLDQCAHLCAATNRWTDAITVWAVRATQTGDHGRGELPQNVRRRSAALRQTRQRLRPAVVSESERRGSAMTLAAAVEFAGLLATSAAVPAESTQAGPGLTAREQELLILVAQGRTDAQLAETMHISIRTVRSHLDRIRDKSGCRRRADMTRLALQSGLV